MKIPRLVIALSIAFILNSCKDNQITMPPYYQDALDGDPSAQLQMGDYYYRPNELGDDPLQAIFWWRKAAELGNAEAQTNLGRSYYRGYGVERDYLLSAFWTKKAANQGYGRASFNLGVDYYHRVIPTIGEFNKDVFYWFSKAAEEEWRDAFYEVGICYEYGIGVKANFQEAVKWYRKSAEAGDPKGQFALGNMYSIGRGISRDVESARLWYNKAASQGHKQASQNLYGLHENKRHNQSKDVLEARIISDDIYGDTGFNWSALRKAVVYIYKDGYGDGKQSFFGALFADNSLTRYLEFERFHDKLMTELGVRSKYDYQDFKSETFPGFNSVYYNEAYKMYVNGYRAGAYDEEMFKEDEIWDLYTENIDELLEEDSQPSEYEEGLIRTRIINQLREEERRLNRQAKRVASPNNKYAAFISPLLTWSYINHVINEGRADMFDGVKYVDGLCLIEGDETSYLYYPLSQDVISNDLYNPVWGLHSDIIYFSTGDSVFSCDIKTKKLEALTKGYVEKLFTEDPYTGFLKVRKSTLKEDGSILWYEAAISPDVKTEIRLTEL